MLKSEMQFWVTKKAVQRKLGSKEDECIISSDAELDSKIELFKSISESCGQLYRIIDQYQERVCILAQEENALGKFLKEHGKNSNTTGKIMNSAGKSISYCGQQRMTIRPPLLRLHHEVETFRGRAVADTQQTIIAMEKERTEYRGALSWMKSASAQLDPDTGRGLDKFRKAQAQTRLAKAKFDRLTLDCLEKIDLLAAARCNMFSHALVAYMSALLQFATKSSETFKATAKALASNPQYNFCILKDLTQVSANDTSSDKHEIEPVDNDQMLFFLDEYKDQKKEETPGTASNQEQPQVSQTSSKIDESSALIDISSSTETSEVLKKTTNLLNNIGSATSSSNTEEVSKDSVLSSVDLLGLSSMEDFGDFTSHKQPPSFMPSQLLLDDILTNDSLLSTGSNVGMHASAGSKTAPSPASDQAKNKSSILDFFNITPNSNKNDKDNKQKSSNTVVAKSKEKIARKDMSAWFQLFSELDPLANPDAMAREIDGGKGNSQAA